MFKFSFGGAFLRCSAIKTKTGNAFLTCSAISSLFQKNSKIQHRTKNNVSLIIIKKIIAVNTIAMQFVKKSSKIVFCFK